MSVCILTGDMRERLRELPDSSVDSCVCDPPYHLTSIVKRFAKVSDLDREVAKKTPHRRTSSGFMGQQWDGGDVAFQPDTWAEVLRVLKPGGHLLAFSGTRTVHRMVCAIEDAGFEIRDSIAWIYGSGFAKSHNLKRNPICACNSNANPLPQSHDKPTTEHNVRPLRDSNLSTGFNLGDQCGQVLQPSLSEQSPPERGAARTQSQSGDGEQPGVEGRLLHRAGEGLSDDPEPRASESEAKRICFGTHPGGREDVGSPVGAGRGGPPSGSQQSEQRPDELEDLRQPQRALAGTSYAGHGQCSHCGQLKAEYEGFGSALKPALEPICLARKPLSEKSIAANVLRWGTGAINVDGCRVEAQGRPAIDATARTTPSQFGAMGGSKAIGSTDLGRWPANLVHDSSDEVLAGFPESNVQKTRSNPDKESVTDQVFGFKNKQKNGAEYLGDSGSAARFFYTAKADQAERHAGLDGKGNTHPTVKPVSLMQWLVRLVTPPGGVVLDPFMGSGSTGIACQREQFSFIGCELSPEYAAIAEARLRQDAGLFADVRAA